MTCNFLSLVFVSIVMSACGCALIPTPLPCAPFDYEYNAYGGSYDRVDRENGRSGSRFAPAQAVDSSEKKLGTPPAAAAEAAETNDAPVAPDSTSAPITSNERYE